MTCGYPASALPRASEPQLGASKVQGPANRDGTPAEVITRSAELNIVIGTSQMAVDDPTLVRRIMDFSGKGEGDVRSRLSMGDSGEGRRGMWGGGNRVMHMAFLDGVAVGWMSSSTSSWGGDGHWGAISVDPAVQGQGIASALVMAAEKRLIEAGCQTVQIEYRFTVGDPAKERLFGWYEGKLGFDGGRKCSGFRCCHKVLTVEAFQTQHKKALLLAGHSRSDMKVKAGEEQQLHNAKRTRSMSVESTTSSSSSSRSPSQRLD